MLRRFFLFLCLPITGCATVPLPVGDASDPQAVSLLQQSADAQGYAALIQQHDVHVGFEGAFSWIVPRVQPVLVDQQFRGKSDEDYLVADEVTTQTHTGPGGTKQVTKKPGDIHVIYNGKESNDPEVKDAAAMVVDDYRMFLFGPAFFLQRHAGVHYVGTADVDGFNCDNLLAVLKPGLGHSPGDRAILSFDRQQHFLRRVRITVNGMDTTQGAVADIFLRDPVRISGVVLPTRFYEELKRPFDAPVHHWRMTSIYFK